MIKSFFKFIGRLIWGRSLSDVLNEQVSVRVHGIKFTIKKIDPLAYLDGSKVMLQEFDTYKVGKSATGMSENALKTLRAHYIDVFMAGVVSPQLCRKEEDRNPSNIFVEYLFTDWALAHDLYNEVMGFTYGKKKRRLSTLQKTRY